MEYESIAVVVDRQGQLTRFSDDILVNVYHRQGKTWVCTERMPFFLDPGLDLAGMRDKLRALIDSLGQTRILLAASICGVAYSVLDQRGFRLCEMDSFSPEEADVLDALVERVVAPVKAPSPPYPAEIAPGVYQCDLTEVLREHPDLSTKKVLRPFFDKTPFVELRMAFSHVPPWLLPELVERGLVWSEPVSAGDKLWMTVRPSTCARADV
ncbi:MAG: hypothetical protein LBR31_06035 [Desulfovibrio sp.]|jgi:hypothetical protein|nr:hypothetical protein [Desulfovibrio sp.]